MKKLFSVSIIIVFFLLVVVSPVSAQRTLPVRLNNSASVAAMQENQQNRMEQQTNTRLERAEKEVTRRLTALQRLMEKIVAAENLSAELKTTLRTQIKTEVANLTTLQTKLQKGTALAESDVQTILNTYNAYALSVQKAHVLVAADRILVTVNLMHSQATQLQEKITVSQTAGNDVTELQRLLAAMENTMGEAETQAQNAIEIVTPLTPVEYTNNKTELQNARQMVRNGYQSLLSTRDDVNQMISILTRLERTNTASVTPQLTCIPRPACLDATPACDVVEPTNGWCSTGSPNASVVR